MFFEWCILPPNATADNWPGWRGDGTGISTETSVVTEWNENKNIRWKIEIPGYGHSSPVVWDNHVFLTTAQRGQKTEIAKIVLLVALGLFTVVIGLWSIATFFRFPLQPYKSFETIDRANHLTQFARLLGLFVVYLIVGFGMFMALRWLLREYSAQLNSLGINWKLSGSTNGAGYLWALLGIFGAGCVFLFNRLIDARYDQNFSESISVKKTWNPVKYIFTFFAIAGFLGLSFMHFFTLIKPASGNFDTSWVEISAICSLGILAAVGSFRKDASWRLAGSLSGLVMMLILLLIMFNESVKWTGRAKVYGLIYFMTLSWILFFILKDLVQRRQQAPWAVQNSTLVHTGPVAMLLLVALQMVSGRFFLTSPTYQYQAICVDRKTGAILWQTICTKGKSKNVIGNSHATPTPVTDGKYVYTNFGDKGTFCLDLKGDMVWQNTEAVPPFSWCASSSPVLYENMLIITNDSDTKSFTAAFEKNQGHKLWEHVRQSAAEDIDSYSTPVVVPAATGAQLVHHSFSFVTGYDIKTGNSIWALPLPGYTAVVCPVAWNDTIIYTYRGAKPHQMIAIQLSEEKTNRNPKTVWQTNKMTPGISSPVVQHGLIYAITDAGVATCRDAANGIIKWKTRLSRSRYYSSVTAAGDKLFFSNLDGETFVLAAGDNPAILSSNQLAEPIYASMAISNGEIFIRTEKHLYCISEK